MITSLNPTTGNSIKYQYSKNKNNAIAPIIEQAHKTYQSWRMSSFKERSNLMNKAADLLEERKEELAKTITREMGKVITEARSEIEKCAWVCRYYADHAVNFLKDEIIETDASKSFVSFQPIGVVLAVMPWNYPFWQVFRFAAPALMAGNTGLLKHASNVPASAKAIEQIFLDAGFPEHAFTTLLIDSGQVEKVIEHPLVKAVTLTGSEAAGRAVAKKAGEELKKTVLELGGSDPYIILEDANLQEAVATCIQSRMLNAGQSCISAKRLIVVEKIYYSFVSLLTERLREIKMGDPMQEDTDIGPMARFDLRDELHEQVQESIKQGAQLIMGGQVPAGEGAYYPPTLLTDVTPEMTAFKEELFGPVVAVIRADDEAHAIELANQSQFGLGGAVFTRDIIKGQRIAKKEIQAGSCFVNAMVKSDPRLPFGGIGISGYGRELSHYGIREFVNVKTIYVK